MCAKARVVNSTVSKEVCRGEKVSLVMEKAHLVWAATGRRCGYGMPAPPAVVCKVQLFKTTWFLLPHRPRFNTWLVCSYSTVIYLLKTCGPLSVALCCHLRAAVVWWLAQGRWCDSCVLQTSTSSKTTQFLIRPSWVEPRALQKVAYTARAAQRPRLLYKLRYLPTHLTAVHAAFLAVFLSFTRNTASFYDRATYATVLGMYHMSLRTNSMYQCLWPRSCLFIGCGVPSWQQTHRATPIYHNSLCNIVVWYLTIGWQRPEPSWNVTLAADWLTS